MTIPIFTINKDKCIVYHVEKIQNTYFQFDRRFPNGNCCTHVHSELIFENINVETVNIYVKESVTHSQRIDSYLPIILKNSEMF